MHRRVHFPVSWKATAFNKLLNLEQAFPNLERLTMHLNFTQGDDGEWRCPAGFTLINLSKRTQLKYLHIYVDVRGPKTDSHNFAVRSPHIQHLVIGPKTDSRNVLARHTFSLAQQSYLPNLQTLSIGSCSTHLDHEVLSKLRSSPFSGVCRNQQASRNHSGLSRFLCRVCAGCFC